ncbi:hypothetical protein [Streptomyces sp. bgisy153]|uniref:hypothetical protein n=1 Tax=Streptomyces sp. bgisy153 TaxID=3413793 RepID=UPI003D721501
MKQKSNRISIGSNRARAAAVQNLRRSGASGPHASKPNRQRDRSGARRAAIRYSALSG